MQAIDKAETIVIVGGGSIGLSTAYNLARKQEESNGKKVVVLEALNEPFGATSGSCTGCLHYKFRGRDSDKLADLGKYSFELWQALSSNPDFRTAVGYRPHCFFELNPGTGAGLENLPNWFEPDTRWDTDLKVLRSPNAMVNPRGVGPWLANECRRLGVDIRLGATLTSVELTSSNTVKSVTYSKDGTLKKLGCRSLVIAAGPWTPTLYSTLFPSSLIRLESALNAGDWLLFRNPFPVTDQSIAFIALDGIVGEKLEFAGREDGTIWLIGRKDYNTSLPPLGESAKPDPSLVEELTDRAKEYLRRGCRADHQFCETVEIIGTGRGIRPAASSLLPIISQVKGKDIADSVDDPVESSGVLGQLILGETPDIDVALFDIGRDRIL
ncbi:nucleotide-binding domain-containing protein [Nemania abortiva]|nr:nucleotide-binding domain-containing protein [Nemania abortiva]